MSFDVGRDLLLHQHSLVKTTHSLILPLYLGYEKIKRNNTSQLFFQVVNSDSMRFPYFSLSHLVTAAITLHLAISYHFFLDFRILIFIIVWHSMRSWGSSCKWKWPWARTRNKTILLKSKLCVMRPHIDRLLVINKIYSISLSSVHVSCAL